MPDTEIKAINAIADQAINRRVAAQHPQFLPTADRPTTQCTYDGRPAVRVDTGQYGNRYGLCAECATAHDHGAEAEAATARAAAQFRANNPDVREPAESANLTVAIHVARRLLDSDQAPVLREALRILLRALDTETEASR
jgi:hypothetical protein